MSLSFSIVVAIDSKGGIGKNNKLMWNIPSDLKRFKKITTKDQSSMPDNHGINIVFMGRKTFDSIPNELPKRYKIVISNKTRNEVIKNYKPLTEVFSFEGLIWYIKKEMHSEEEQFVIGGASIYEQFLPYVNKIYLTEVKGNYNADTFFKFNRNEFKETHIGEWQEENGYTFRFLELERI